MALASDHLPINVGREPLFVGEGVAACAFYVSRAAINTIAADGPEWKFYDASLVADALLNPLAVFEGLRRAEFEDGYCYVSKPPPERWKGDDNLTDEEKRQFVFLVYVKKLQGLIVFDWAWRREDNNNPNYPEGWEKDFSKGRIWPPNKI